MRSVRTRCAPKDFAVPGFESASRYLQPQQPERASREETSAAPTAAANGVHPWQTSTRTAPQQASYIGSDYPRHASYTGTSQPLTARQADLTHVMRQAEQSGPKDFAVPRFETSSRRTEQQQPEREETSAAPTAAKGVNACQTNTRTASRTAPQAATFTGSDYSRHAEHYPVTARQADLTHVMRQAERSGPKDFAVPRFETSSRRTEPQELVD